MNFGLNPVFSARKNEIVKGTDVLHYGVSQKKSTLPNPLFLKSIK